MLIAILLVGGQAVAWAQTVSPLANIDRDLNLLCAHLGSAPNAEALQLRVRLAALWHEREAILGRIPINLRAATLRSSMANPQCLNLAKLEAEHFPPAAGGSPHAVTRNGTGPSIVTGPAAVNGVTHHEHRAPEPTTPVPPTGTPGFSSGNTRIATPNTTPQPTLPPANVWPTGPSAAPTINSTTTQLEEFFPWPPPEPSARVLLHLPQLGGAPATTWGEAADQLMVLLQHGRFSSWGFYAAPGGFAIVTQIEQLDDQSGHALTGNDRFASETRVASLNVLNSIFTVRRAQGLYRVIAFVLTTDPRSGGAATDPARMLQLARRWGISGALDLPEAMRRQPVIPEQRLIALIYEFESAVGGDTRINAPGRWSFDAHLADAGIVLQP